jgi:DNA replication and repair protein RecF
MGGTRLDRLQIHHVRNLEQVALQDLRRINVFYGRNGSGKTSVLEAVHLLAMARSFRGSIKSLVTHGQQTTTVFGQKSPGALSVGVRRDMSGEVMIKIGGEPVRTVATLAEQLPVQVINADSFDLLTGAPGARRQYLDWGVFHVEHRFFEQWQRFQRGLKQRNKLLRRGKIDAEELSVWTRELAGSGEALTNYRSAYFQLLTPRFRSIMAQLMPSLSGLELRFRQGWDKQSTYAEALANSDVTDRDQGFTHVGPQRADIRVLIDGHLAAETLSRGQQKLVICGLKLAQGQLMAEMGEKHCIYLVDDLPSELDAQHSERVCAQLDALDTQVFITCVQKHEIASAWPRLSGDDLVMFHVEHGRIVREDA